MFYFPHTFFIGPLLFQFIFPIALGWGGVSIARCVWVEHPHVNECTLSISPPKTLCNNVEPGSIFSVGSLVMKLFTGGGLQAWLYSDTMANPTQEVCCDVTDFIVPDGRKSASWSAKCMLDGKMLATDTTGW